MHALLWILPCLALLAACNGAPEPAAGDARPSSAGGSDARAAERARMVREQIAARGVSDPRVLDALRRVPRHLFVPQSLQGSAYDDGALPIGAGQTISQPFIVALMTEALAPGPEERVLEVGTGSGYQAAVLSELCAEVFTIEIVPALAERARRVLAEQGRTKVHVRTGDGWKGWPEEAPFDAIMVTAAPDELPPALVEQLRPGGRLVIPVGPSADRQELWLYVKRPDGALERTHLIPVRFVPMTGGR